MELKIYLILYASSMNNAAQKFQMTKEIKMFLVGFQNY